MVNKRLYAQELYHVLKQHFTNTVVTVKWIYHNMVSPLFTFQELEASLIFSLWIGICVQPRVKPEIPRVSLGLCRDLHVY